MTDLSHMYITIEPDLDRLHRVMRESGFEPAPFEDAESVEQDDGPPPECTRDGYGGI